MSRAAMRSPGTGHALPLLMLVRGATHTGRLACGSTFASTSWRRFSSRVAHSVAKQRSAPSTSRGGRLGSLRGGGRSGGGQTR